MSGQELPSNSSYMATELLFTAVKKSELDWMEFEQVLSHEMLSFSPTQYAL